MMTFRIGRVASAAAICAAALAGGAWAKDEGPGTYFEPEKGTANVAAKVAAKPGSVKKTVAFLGGSITEMNGFRPRVMKKLREKYPDVAFTEIASGLSSTCSDAGAFRLEEDVLAKGVPDLFVVEAAVNDDQDGHFSEERSIRGMEGTVRHVLTRNPNCAVVVGLMVNVAQYKSLLKGVTPKHYAAHAKVAAYYGAALADVGSALVAEGMRGGMGWKEYGDCHPSPAGCDLGAKVVMAAIDSVFDPRAARKAKPLPPPLDAHSYSRGVAVPAGKLTLGKGWNASRPDWQKVPGSKRGYFTRGPAIWSETAGSELSFSFVGDAVGLFLTAGPDAGNLEATVDGKPVPLLKLRADYGSLHYPYVHMVADGLAQAKHTVRLKVVAAQRAGKACTAVRIHRVFVNGVASDAEKKPAEKIDPLYQKIVNHPMMAQLRLRLMLAIKQGDKKAMGEICAAALKLDPADAVWQYNLSCSIADGDDAKAALDALEKAIKLGYRDAKGIAADKDFAKVNKLPRFKELVKLAEKTARDPVPGVPTPQVLEAKAGKAVRMTESNLVWNVDLGMYQALVKYDGGDLYVNRDNNHSPLQYGRHPGVARVDFPVKAKQNWVNTGLPNTLYGGVPVFGNVSQGYHQEPIRRSLLRGAMTGIYGGEYPFKRMAACYLDNQVWCIPAVWDFPGRDYYGKPVGQGGDIYFPGQCPYAVVSVGASCTDLPFLKAILDARAKMSPETLKAMREKRLVGPTTQWLLRRSHRRVETPEDYLTCKAHPTAYNILDLDTNRLNAAAAKLTPEELPPVALLRMVNTKIDPVPFFTPGKDYPDVQPEPLYLTPCAIAIVLRAEPGRREFCFAAAAAKEFAAGVEYCWKVVHGDPERVTVSGFSVAESPAKGFARVTIDRIGMTTNRIDLACFARVKGMTDWGAPSFVSFSAVAQEAREYDGAGRLVSIDYANPDKVPYVDGVIALPRKWKDEYRYGADGKLKEVVRTQAGAGPRTFSAAAFRKLKYMPRASADANKFSELTYVEE